MGDEQNELDWLAQAYDLCKQVERLMNDHSPKWHFLKCVWCLVWWRPLRLLEEALQLHGTACGVNTQTPLRERICHLANEAKREFQKTLIVDVVAAMIVLVCVLIVLPPTFRRAASWIIEILPPPTSVVAPPPSPVFTDTVAFTITCAPAQTHTVRDDKTITLWTSNVVLIEPNVAPEEWETLTGTLRKLPNEEKKFSYAPGNSEWDHVVFTFVKDERTGEVTTSVLRIEVVPEKRGLCHP